MKRLLVIIWMSALIVTGCTNSVHNDDNLKKQSSYGVFLSIDHAEIEKLSGYDTVVIDAQYFTKEDITTLHNAGQTVYSYINLGSMENFRDYYAEYEDLCLDVYENWEEERWINVSDSRWKIFMLDLAQSMKDQGIDGFFVDNCDVYSHYESEENLLAIADILKGFKEGDKRVIINGGDYFVDTYFERYGTIKDILTGINQETIISGIDFDNERLVKQTKKERKYYEDYVTRYAKEGADIYLLEYTTDENLKQEIHDYCNENAFYYYISDSIELD